MTSIDKEGEEFDSAMLLTFLFHYFCCEVAAKLLQGFRGRLSPHDALHRSKTVNVTNLKTALRGCQIVKLDAIVDRIFKVSKGGAKDMSARDLRNKTVHELHPLYISEIKKRCPATIDDMRVFLTKIEEWSTQLH